MSGEGGTKGGVSKDGVTSDEATNADGVQTSGGAQSEVDAQSGVDAEQATAGEGLLSSGRPAVRSTGQQLLDRRHLRLRHPLPRTRSAERVDHCLLDPLGEPVRPLRSAC